MGNHIRFVRVINELSVQSYVNVYIMICWTRAERRGMPHSLLGPLHGRKREPTILILTLGEVRNQLRSQKVRCGNEPGERTTNCHTYIHACTQIDERKSVRPKGLRGQQSPSTRLMVYILKDEIWCFYRQPYESRS